MRPLLAASLLLGLATVHAAERPVVVVTTSLIATAVRDVAGEAVDIETLMAAGTCPGQFDLEPQQARRVHAAALVIRHQFQGFLDARFAAAGIGAGAVVAPAFEEPLTVPEHYVRFCEAVAAELGRHVPALAATSRAQLPAIRERAREEAERLRRDAAPLAGTRVVAAAFQAGFLRWLGLEVVAVLPPEDDPLPQAWLAAMAAGRATGAVLVIGNEQNGRRRPAAMAAALGVPLVMLSNFPSRAAAGAYEDLLDTNLRTLLGWKATIARAASGEAALHRRNPK